MEITVGQVAGVIAALIVVVQVLAPLIIAFILAGYLRDSETASTWTLAAQKLQSSLWPSLLRLDTAHKAGRVRGAIRILAAAMPIVALLTAIAGIVTPLGLGEEMRPTGQSTPSFQYTPDGGAFPAGTTPRGTQELSRLCSRGRASMGFAIACPYHDDAVEFNQDDEGIEISFDNLSTDIPDILREIFSSGTAGEGTTVANFFDIEYRQYTSTVQTDYNNNEPYGAGLYRQLQSFILEDKYILVEGLIIDTKIGGIGLRNHTIPTGMSQGATWEEDILFIEPDVACVNTNLTIDYTIRYNSSDTNVTSGEPTDLVLVDQGGFVDLNTTYPEYDRDNGQANPDLYTRAMRGAFLNNAYTMFIYNVSNPNSGNNTGDSFEYMNSEKGKRFPLPSLLRDTYLALGMSAEFANYLDFSNSNSSSFDIPDYPNPFDVTTDELRDIGLSCSGAGADDDATLNNIYVGCGLLRGAPKRTNEGPKSLMEDGSTWSSPLHSCAAALRATIKTVTFSYNSTNTGGLAGLSVTNIKEKEYANEQDQPLWGFEESGLTVMGIRPTWGLISPEYESRDNVSSVRAPHLNLPGYYGPLLHQTLHSGFGDNYPASDFAPAAMNTVFELNSDWPFDLLGHANMAIFTRWQDLSDDPEKAADILRLLWTDLAASGLVGTKGVLGAMNSGDSDVARVTVQPIQRRITYQFLYGIPAFILALTIIILVAIFLFSICIGRGSIAKLRLRIQQISPGRIFTSFLYTDASNLTMPSNEWAHANGIKNVTVGTYAERSMKPTGAITVVSPLVEQKQ